MIAVHRRVGQTFLQPNFIKVHFTFKIYGNRVFCYFILYYPVYASYFGARIAISIASLVYCHALRSVISPTDGAISCAVVVSPTLGFDSRDDVMMRVQAPPSDQTMQYSHIELMLPSPSAFHSFYGKPNAMN
jgi:hypothetical protein